MQCPISSTLSQISPKIISTLLITNILIIYSIYTWAKLAQSKAPCLRLALYLESIPPWKMKSRDDFFKNWILFTKQLHLQIYVALFFELESPFFFFSLNEKLKMFWPFMVSLSWMHMYIVGVWTTKRRILKGEKHQLNI